MGAIDEYVSSKRTACLTLSIHFKEGSARAGTVRTEMPTSQSQKLIEERHFPLFV